jgi:hypothetical protein
MGQLSSTHVIQASFSCCQVLLFLFTCCCSLPQLLPCMYQSSSTHVVQIYLRYCHNSYPLYVHVVHTSLIWSCTSCPLHMLYKSLSATAIRQLSRTHVIQVYHSHYHVPAVLYTFLHVVQVSFSYCNVPVVLYTCFCPSLSRQLPCASCPLNHLPVSGSVPAAKRVQSWQRASTSISSLH